MTEFEKVVLRDPSSSLAVTYVPAAGMIATSLTDGDVEFLGQRRGLDAYIADGKTMGIPILYPWANRLSGTEYDAAGTEVTLTAGTGGVRTDAHGAPMHGVLAAHPGWQVTDRSANTLTAALDYRTPELLASFPFPHTLTLQTTLADRTLTVTTTVEAGGGAAVPLCFGFHPYLRIPGVERADWLLQTPDMRHLPVDELGIPTGAQRDWPGGTAPLREYDDGFDEVPDGAVFALSGGEYRIEVVFEQGYPAAQLFAPGNDDVVGIEPMAAPTDSLRRGTYRVAAPGRPETARFSLRIS